MTDRTDTTTHFTRANGVRLGYALLALGLLLTGSMAVTVGAAQSTDSEQSPPAESALVVDLETDGAARVTLLTTFDLTTDGERAAFEALRSNETAREQRTNQFAARMRATATRADNASDRDVTIRDPAMTFRTDDDTGVVGLSVTWEALAAREGDQLVLRGPFASGFDIDRPFRVVSPDGYELRTTTPTPTTQQQHSATWSASTQFDGFEAAFAPATDGAATDAGAGRSGATGPGFGIGAVTVAVLTGTALVLVRRRTG
ncbi:DUF7345 domain-containing protein [Halorientalis sp.]|uniref:DUF7345 domain-containing protein n=1 Tax=Halorientalis sp. TaxID=1931229 RepID=UPI0026194922|nr:hypothetical protein [Halorientalis sp.]